MKRMVTSALLVFLLLCCWNIAIADIEYSGKGDDVIELQPFEEMHVYEIEGNKESRHFAVIPYDENGERLSSIVNTTDVYKGVVFEPTQKAALLEVKATGDWKITVRPIDVLEKTYKGQTISGEGDTIFIFDDSQGTSMTASITGNKQSRYFAVIPYDEYGNRMSSIVNTTDPYEGKVMLKKDSYIIEVLAEGEWSITFN